MSTEKLLAGLGLNEAEIQEAVSPEGIKTGTNTLAKTNNVSRQGTTSSTTERAKDLLSKGLSVGATASALGVSAARISQLMADEEFAQEVQQTRFEKSQGGIVRDDTWDSIEDKLLAKMESAVDRMYKPETIMKALDLANRAKRRGTPQSAPVETKQVVSITIPVAIKPKFTTNINNQVVQVGDRELITMDTGNLNKIIEGKSNVIEEKPNDTAGDLPSP